MTDKIDNQQAAAVQVLLVEDSPLQANLIRTMLRRVSAPSQTLLPALELTCVESLSAALAQMDARYADVILLDLSLPDSRGMETLIKLREQVMDVPIVVLTGNEDETTGIGALQHGAQDYLSKGQITPALLGRAVRYAIERHRLLRSLSLTDELTALYNRRGFTTLAEQHLKFARRTQKGFLLVYVDLDGVKAVNDAQGHHVGSQMIASAAEVLKKSFRSADIIARLGGDEFVVLIVDGLSDNIDLITHRLQNKVREFNAHEAMSFELAMSIGVAIHDGGDETLDELIGRADQLMYQDKRRRKKS